MEPISSDTRIPRWENWRALVVSVSRIPRWESKWSPSARSAEFPGRKPDRRRSRSKARAGDLAEARLLGRSKSHAGDLVEACRLNRLKSHPGNLAASLSAIRPIVNWEISTKLVGSEPVSSGRWLSFALAQKKRGPGRRFHRPRSPTSSTHKPKISGAAEELPTGGSPRSHEGKRIAEDVSRPKR